ncbi:MAG: trigger factor [Bacteroidales bacterium]|nr:trigger factor [Bacteroidales bacterium]
MADELPETGDATAVANPEEAIKLTQHVDITDIGPCKKHVKVSIERGIIDARLDEKFSDLVRQHPAQVPGFRLGKAPRKIIMKKFQKEVAAEVKNEILMASLEQMAEESTLSPLSPPDLDPNAVVIPDDGPMIYEFDIEVRPEFDLPEYKGRQLRRPTYTITDTDIQKELGRLLEPFGQIIPKDGAVEADDLVTADLVVTHNGKELNRSEEIRVKIEKRLAFSDGIVENFAKQMAGAKVGETRTVNLVISQEVSNEALRGQTMQAAFTVKDIKTIRQPELTPEILAHFGVRSEDILREIIRIRLERSLAYNQRQAIRQDLMRQLASNTNLDLPRDLLIRQSRRALARRVMEMQESGISDEQIEARRRVLEQDVVRSTMIALKEHFVLQKIAELEKIEVEESDIDNEIERLADQANESPRKMRARLEREDLIETIATELLERKALNLVLETATYEDYEMNPAEVDEGDVATVQTEVAASGEETAPAN